MFDNVNKISFKKRPIALSAEYRPLFKIVQLMLVLKICSQREKASLLKLHLFSWMMRNQEEMENTNKLIRTNQLDTIPIWRLEPSLNRALNFAVAEQLLIHKDGKYSLADKGKVFIQEILNDEDFMKVEKSFLKSIGKRITEKKVRELSKTWGGSQSVKV
ncbi:hypothetical protein [Bacillus sp. K6W]|uniref:hypothetical protein n=1 Tax=Bacillus sp. K6W TaxID=2249215 RepID=UPI000BF4DB28|nr:hypothetical protein [Bacillus sp. K6W]PEW38898.1 hypothetical protein CN431_20145 [Bacillus cereus]